MPPAARIDLFELMEFLEILYIAFEVLLARQITILIEEES